MIHALSNRGVLRGLSALDTVYLALRESRRRRATAFPAPPGAGIQSERPVDCIERDGISWPCFSTLAHAFWRAQELTLFRRSAATRRLPCLDLGCGDGRFGELAGFAAGRIGLDADPASLRAAMAPGRPGMECLQADVTRLPLAGQRLRECVSNSVLEHVQDLDGCFRDVRRVLAPGGRFVFSMTTAVYARQLTRLTGARDAARWTRIFGHVQQISAPEVFALLERNGFSVEVARSYQPLSFTALHRFFLSPVFQSVERRCAIRWQNRLMSSLFPIVKESVDMPPAYEGAGLYVEAIRTS